MPEPTASGLPTITLQAVPESVRTARRFVLERVAGCSQPVTDNAVLVASELCTNCVLHARSDFQLRVSVEETSVRIEVVDDNPELPDPGHGGRGLALVEAVTSSWGVDEAVAGPGKVVWAELSLER